jgi:hypothetical protein
MRSGYVYILSAVFVAACCGAQTDSLTPETVEETSPLTIESTSVPVSLRLCEDVSEDALSGAIEAGFFPHYDAEGALVAVGVVVSGSADEDALETIESAECVTALDRADERVIETPGAP